MELNKKRESDFGKKVGVAEWRVLKFSPTRYELNKILGKEGSETDTELEYTGESDEGKRAVRVTAWIEDVRTKYKTNVTFFLEDKDKIASTGRTQYVNAVGNTSYVDSEENLQDWFRKAMTYRIAKEGEEYLMEFLRRWMENIELDVNKGGNRNNILLDLGKLFKGDFSELNTLVDSEYAGTVLCCATVRAKKTDEGTKTYQSVFNKMFLPGYCIQYFGDTKKTPPGYVQEFKSDMTGPYGPKDFFILEPLRDYKEGENPVEADKALLNPQSPKY